MKKIISLIIVLVTFMSGCKIQGNKLAETITPTGEEVTGSSLTSSPVTTFTPPSEDSAYSAYYQKYTEIAAKYGKGQLEDINKGNFNEASYLKGVCVVDLVDFNGDGIKDLLLIYSNGRYTGKNTNSIAIPQANTYEIEVWTYTDGEMKQLLHEPHVGSFYSFNTKYWDADNCFVTVYEKDDGLPIIQLYDESKNSCSYTNLYYSSGTVVKDKFTYKDKTFTSNGVTITEDKWNENNNAYKNILSSVYLSSAQYSSSRLLEELGIDYKDTIKQTEKIVDSLSNSQSSEFKAAEGEYIPLYLQELDHLNQIRLTEDDFGMPIGYSIYDIDQNGTPELIVLTGNCEAAYRFNIYTVVNGKLVHCGEVSGSHTSLYTNGKSGIVSYSGQMGSYSINKIAMEGTNLKTYEVTSGETKDEYPKLDKFGLGEYNKRMSLSYGMVPFLMYSYSNEK